MSMENDLNMMSTEERKKVLLYNRCESWRITLVLVLTLGGVASMVEAVLFSFILPAPAELISPLIALATGLAIFIYLDRYRIWLRRLWVNIETKVSRPYSQDDWLARFCHKIIKLYRKALKHALFCISFGASTIGLALVMANFAIIYLIQQPQPNVLLIEFCVAIPLLTFPFWGLLLEFSQKAVKELY